eukprot:991815-Amphidinium_carterae.3
MVRDVTALTPNAADVVWVTTQTHTSGCGCHFLGSSSRCSVLNSMLSSVPYKSANRMKWLAIGVVKAVQTLQTRRRHPKGRNRVSKSELSRLFSQDDAYIRGAADDLHGNGQADVLANHWYCCSRPT